MFKERTGSYPTSETDHNETRYRRVSLENASKEKGGGRIRPWGPAWEEDPQYRSERNSPVVKIIVAIRNNEHEFLPTPVTAI